MRARPMARTTRKRRIANEGEGENEDQ